MSIVLVIAAVVMVVCGILLSGGGISVIPALLGLAGAALCIGVVKALDNQDKILHNQERLLDGLRQLTDKDVQVCVYCGKSFGARQTSCPHCGHPVPEED